MTEDLEVGDGLAFEPSLPVHANPAGQRRLVKDIGAHLRRIRGLKVGSATKRTPEMIAEILERLRDGETLLSVTCDKHIAGHSTVYDWMEADPELADAIEKARAVGAQVLFDARIDVALDGAFGTGDRLRDELVQRVLADTAAKRNRNAFQDKVTIDGQIGIAPVVLPTVALPSIPDAEFSDVDDDKSE
ncbi:terminase small subunit-like protein [Sphingomonas melonis]